MWVTEDRHTFTSPCVAGICICDCSCSGSGSSLALLRIAAAVVWWPLQTRQAATPPLGLGIIHPPPDGITRRPDHRLCFIIILPLQPTVKTHSHVTLYSDIDGTAAVKDIVAVQSEIDYSKIILCSRRNELIRPIRFVFFYFCQQDC